MRLNPQIMPNAAHDLSPNGLKAFTFYRAERMHSADYAVTRCLSVRLSVRLFVSPSHAGIVC